MHVYSPDRDLSTLEDAGLTTFVRIIGSHAEIAYSVPWIIGKTWLKLGAQMA